MTNDSNGGSTNKVFKKTAFTNASQLTVPCRPPDRTVHDNLQLKNISFKEHKSAVYFPSLFKPYT